LLSPQGAGEGGSAAPNPRRGRSGANIAAVERGF
jgi:hypothetical protein